MDLKVALFGKLSVVDKACVEGSVHKFNMKTGERIWALPIESPDVWYLDFNRNNGGDSGTMGAMSAMSSFVDAEKVASAPEVNLLSGSNFTPGHTCPRHQEPPAWSTLPACPERAVDVSCILFAFWKVRVAVLES